MLREIAQNLKEAHEGRIPIVRPHRQHSKAKDLKPERYLFQWAATPDGRYGAFLHDDINDLRVLILYGLEFRTKQGEPFVVSTHLLRHVMATVSFPMRHIEDGHISFRNLTMIAGIDQISDLVKETVVSGLL